MVYCFIVPRPGFAFIHAVGSVHSSRLVELVEHGEETLVGSLPVGDLASVAVKVIENGLAHRAGRGNHNHERLSAARGRLFHNLVEIAVAYRVELVDNNGVRIEAVEGVRVRSQRLKLGGRRREINIVSPLLENGGELGALLHHVYGLGERLFRLVFLGRYGVNLRRALVICDEHIDARAARSVLLPFFRPTRKSVSRKRRYPVALSSHPKRSCINAFWKSSSVRDSPSVP